MAKPLVLNEEIVSKMKSVLGKSIDLSKYVVYECRAIGTEPISKIGNPLLNGAVPSENFIDSLYRLANAPKVNVSVHLMHDDYELAIGRVFDVFKSVDMNGINILRARLAIYLDEETKPVVDKINAGILDEVSIGFAIKSAKCSVCGFDYFDKSMDEDERLTHLYEAKCPNGHKIGVNGVHLVLDEAETFSEISIVNQGAARHAKIKDDIEFSLSKPDKDNNAKILLANVVSATYTSKLENCNMTEEEYNVKLAEMQSKIDELEAKLTSSEDADPETEGEPGEVTATDVDTNTDVEDDGAEENDVGVSEGDAEKDAEKEELKVEVQALKSENEKLAAELSAVKQTFTEEVNKVLCAAEKPAVSKETAIDEMVAALSEARLTLGSYIPQGGVSRSANAKNSVKDNFYGVTENQLSAFK